MRLTVASLFHALVFPTAGLACVVAIIALGGHSPARVLQALIDGSLAGSFPLAETAIRSCPLMLAGLGVALAFRAGVWNIGAEGQLYSGALTVVWMAPALSRLGPFAGIPLALVMSFVAGGLWAFIAAMLRVRRGVQEVISTIMLNFIAIQIASWAVHGPLRESSGQFPYSNEIPAVLQLPRLLPPTRLHMGVLLSLLAAAVVWVFLFRTVRGFHVRAVGASTEAARHAGIDPDRSIYLAMFLSGGLAGLAGAVQLLGVSHRLFEEFSPGYGYTAIAVALLGALHPIGVAASAALMGALDAGASAMQREAGVSSVLVNLVQGIIILSVALQAARKYSASAAKRALGAEEV